MCIKTRYSQVIQYASLATAIALGSVAYAANPLVTVLEDFEAGGTAGAVAVDPSNSPATGASNSVVENVSDEGSARLRLSDPDGVYNGAVLTFPGAISSPGYYLITADVKVDNASAPIGTFGMAAVAGGPTTSKISDVNAGYVLNLSGSNDAAKGYQTIGAAVRVPAGATFPMDLTLYFSTDPSGNDFNSSQYVGNFSGTHRGSATTWPEGSTNAVYIDNIKRLGPGNFGEERHLWISSGDGFPNLASLEQQLLAAKQNNFNCVDILARFRADAYYVPNRTDKTYPNPEPMGTRISGGVVNEANDPLQYAIDRGHELGLKVYISFSAFLVSTTASYPSFLPSGSITYYYNNGTPRAMTLSDPSGADGFWADAGRADVRNYTKNVLMDIVSNYDIDGVIFDRMRYPFNSYGYNPQALKEMGITGAPAPTNASFRQARQDAVATFLHDAYEAVTAKKPWVVVGATPVAMLTSMNDTYNTYMQLWPEWSAAKTANRAVSFGVCDLYEPQFYRLWNSGVSSNRPEWNAPGANAVLMNKAQFGDTAVLAFDYGLTPGAYSFCSPLLYHPYTDDTNQSYANAENIIDTRNLAMSGWGIFRSKLATDDIDLIRSTSSNSAGVDVLEKPAPTADYLFKAGYDNIAPNGVTEFAVKGQQDGSAVLSWKAPLPAKDGEVAAGYLVYKSTSRPVKEYWQNLVQKNPVPGSATSFTVPAGATGAYYFKVVPVDDYNNRGPASELGPITLGGEAPKPADIIVDNANASIVGTWTVASSSTDKYGNDYCYRSKGAGASKVNFTANVKQDGLYNVYEWHCAGSNRTSAARHSIASNSGVTVANANQQVNGGKWNKLATVALSGGKSYVASVDDYFTVGTIVVGDAMRWSFAGQLPGTPEPPTAMEAKPYGSSQANLTWLDNASNESCYVLGRSTTPGGPYTTIATLPPDTTTYSDPGLAAGTYYYVVRANNASGNSLASNEASATVPVPAPGPQENLAAKGISQTVVVLNWEDKAAVDSDTDHIIMRSTTPGGPYAEIAKVAPNVTQYSDTALEANVTYYYVVCAANGDVKGTNSNEASAKTLPYAPKAPASLGAMALSQTAISISWVDNADNEESFEVERSAAGEAAQVIVTLPADATSYVDNDLTADTEYTYKVRAVNAGGKSDDSNAASATTLPYPPAAPTGLVAAATSWDKISLNWTDNAQNEAAYEVLVADSAQGPFTPLAALEPNTTSYVEQGLLPQATRYYVVRAVNAGGSSPDSEAAGAQTPKFEGIFDDVKASAEWSSVPNPTAQNGSYTGADRRTVDSPATWNYTVPVAGSYEIFAFVPTDEKLSTQARYSVNSQGATATVVVDQRHNSGWVSLGVYTLSAGANAVSVYQQSNTTLWLSADAIKVVQK